jgi:DNA-binding MarR family transcriptional regulator
VPEQTRSHDEEPAQEEQTPSGVELSEAFKMVSHQFMRWGQFWFSNQRLSIPRVMVLKTVAEHGLHVGNREGYLRMIDIAEELGVTPRNITTIVDGLEREGLLVRRRDATDRRAIRLELTPQGKEQIEEIEQTMNTVSERFFAPLDAAQRRQLLTILQTLGNAYNLPGEANCPVGAVSSEGKQNIHDRMRERAHELHGHHRHHSQ